MATNKCTFCKGEDGWHNCPDCKSKHVHQMGRKYFRNTELECFCDDCLIARSDECITARTVRDDYGN